MSFLGGHFGDNLFNSPIKWALRHGGEPTLQNEWKGLTSQGGESYDYGKTLTEEGLGGLRSLDTAYSGRLSDPLGAVGRGIFTRARGGLQDDYARMVNSGDARAAQLARQSGGTLTPEQVAAMDAQNRRSAGEGLFRGTGDVANAEASATLTEQGKLFDRLEGIRKTIVGVGQDEKSRGLSTILAALAGRGKLLNINMGPFGKAGVGG